MWKIPPETRETLLKNDGVFPCYHMNRDNWVSIALDERLPDGTILDLLRRSQGICHPLHGKEA